MHQFRSKCYSSPSSIAFNFAKYFLYALSVLQLSSKGIVFALYTNRKHLDDAADDFSSHLISRGFDVREGSLKFFFKEDCIDYVDLIGTCFGNNPGTPYGIYQLPHIPGEQYDDLIPAIGTNNLGLEVRIRSDEAIVLIGVTPPESAYFGYTHYLWKTRNKRENNNPLFTAASLDDTINPYTINVGQRISSSYDAAFDKDVVITSTGDQGTARAVDRALTKAGIPRNIRNLQKISTKVGGPLPPVGLYNPGLEEDKDSILFLNRVAVFQNETLGSQYLKNPPFRLFRITPKERNRRDLRKSRSESGNDESNFKIGRQKQTILNRDPIGDTRLATLNREPVRNKPDTSINNRYVVPLRTPQRSLSESKFKKSLDRLEDVIRSNHNIKEQGEVVLFPLIGSQCIFASLECYGDNGDTAYFIARPEFTMPTDDNYYVVIGVNHMATGRSVYAEVGGYQLSTATGIASFESINNMPGSAETYLNRNDSKYLYAFTARRDCTGIDFCMTLPFPNEGFPFLETEEPPGFIFRAIMSPGGPGGPDPKKLIMARVFYAQK